MSPAVPPTLAALAALAGLRALAVALADRPASGPPAGWLRRGRRPAWLARLGTRLRRAGIGVPPEAALALTAAAALAAGCGAFLVLRHPVAGILAAAAVAAGARGVLASADRRHLARVAAQLPGVAGRLAASLGAGLSLRQALTRAARDAPEPVAEEVRRVAAELALGARLEDALDDLARRVPHPDAGLLVTAILVQRRAGGDLARALGDLSARLDERTALARELGGATAQARATAWLVAALPLAGGVLVELAAPGTLARTLGQGAGLVILVVAAGLQALGVLLVRRLARVEP